MTFYGRVRRRRSQKVRVRLGGACRGEALGQDGLPWRSLPERRRAVAKLNSKEAA